MTCICKKSIQFQSIKSKKYVLEFLSKSWKPFLGKKYVCDRQVGPTFLPKHKDVGLLFMCGVTSSLSVNPGQPLHRSF